MTTGKRSKEFEEWMSIRGEELLEYSKMGPTEEERILAKKVLEILGMIKNEYDKTHEENE